MMLRNRILTEGKVREFLKDRIKKKQTKNVSLQESLFSYHIIINEHAHLYPTTSGILLFGKNPQHFFEYAIIICSHFRGNSGRDSIASQDCTGTLIDQYNKAYEFILSRLNWSFTIKGKFREETLEIPEVAIREILANAIIHRNYHIKSPIKIAIYENRVEIFSPGSFPGPINQQNLTMGFTFLRNPAIAKVFRELGVIEMMGTGFITVFQSYKDANLKTPEVIEAENYVKCILPRATVNREYKNKYEESETEIRDILSLFTAASEISISDIIDRLRISRSTAARRIAMMIQGGLIKKIGKGKGTRYKKI